MSGGTPDAARAPARRQVKVTIFHNAARGSQGQRDRFGYRAGHPLIRVFETGAAPAEPDVIADQMFDIFNLAAGKVPAEAEAAVWAYRRGGRRSLSVGDVVQVGDVALAVAPRGFIRAALPLNVRGDVTDAAAPPLTDDEETGEPGPDAARWTPGGDGQAAGVPTGAAPAWPPDPATRPHQVPPVRPVLTLAQIRDGTGWPPGARFLLVPDGDSPYSAAARDLLARIRAGIEEDDGGWPGGDLVDLVTGWLLANGVTDAQISDPLPADA